ncbi:hypothetical protein SAMN05444004_1374 [Jannaschia faecimaris]|uniref:Uncharacterized protein n=1 Tax=Jannaschia faecimaris TaxID=1244108 RepID=A0A1H3UJR6_9RHOB|nr:hypothetical protein [Jannaschia faecimaris]SDZ62055.1 hypothetical protein SAMN05444004_1374 [Jannaschia faecimaris]
MANLAKTTVFKSISSQKETQLDKTTLVVRRIIEDEAEVRHKKTARLRKARFEREADTPDM